MKPRKKQIIIFFVLVILLIIYTICLYVPKVKTYEFAEKLTVKYYDSTTIDQKENPLYGETANIKIIFDSTSIYNTYYDEGSIIINGMEYKVQNTRYFPRSFLAKLKHELKYMAEIIKYNYDVFWFTIEDDSGYLITIGGMESGGNLHIHIEKDGILYYSYEEQ